MQILPDGRWLPNLAAEPKLANDDQDIRAIQLYLDHRNIQHTVFYTQLATDRFNEFWKD